MSTPPPKPAKPTKSEKAEDTPVTEQSANDLPIGDITLHGSKNVAELLAKDSGDESLRKYKESLLGSAAQGDLGDVSDPRRLIVEEFRVIFAPEENTPDIVHTLSTRQGLAKMASEGISMKEGSRYKIRISFRVQHEIIAGIKFTNLVSRLMVSDKDDLMIGSYPPSSTPHVFEFPKWDYNEAPKGMLLRGKYKVVNTFIDSDKVEHLKYDYELNIVKK
jgi:Rho GDP-dissociation inhibitor